MKWDIGQIREWSWKQHPSAATIPEAGNAQDYKTGGWRSQRPIRDKEKCTDCLICWILCPDSSVLVEDEKIAGFDLDHCKGCGICAEECPRDAIEMVSESEFSSEGGKENG